MFARTSPTHGNRYMTGIKSAHDGNAQGYFILQFWMFSLWATTLGQALAAFVPNLFVAGNGYNVSATTGARREFWHFVTVILNPLVITILVQCAGIVSPYPTLVFFWKYWAYWIDPFHYYAEGGLSVQLHDVAFVCSELEYRKFVPPSGMTCWQVGPYVPC